MDYQSGHVMTLANSIIGVSILAMPYCFKQCGVILSVVILLISSIISRLACHFLLKSAIIARRKTFEFLAFHIFGALGKFAIEIGMIGFLLGTCIAFFVVMGDLGPEIVSEMTGVRTTNATRNSIMVALALFCVLPLGLLKNVDSLNGVSKATIGFYCCLVLKIIIEALPHIFTGDWFKEVELWRPAGILQCLPIFSMALFCQTQLFEIYQALPNASLDKMNSLIRVAVTICTWVYICVGGFGYIAFFQTPFTGNILLSFRPSVMTDVMKIGFVLSLAFSFPLVIFPCRASLFSLLYKGPSYTSLHEGTTTNYIPEGKFKMLTAIIVLVSLIIGIMIPNIELVLGLVGSTIGVMICVLFPVTCFICISPKNTNERILAQIMLFVGVIVMVLGTYANLYAFEEAKLAIVTEKAIVKQDVGNQKNSLNDIIPEILVNPPIELEKLNILEILTTAKVVKNTMENKNDSPLANVDKEENVKEVRHEPPQPEEPLELQVSAQPLKNDKEPIGKEPEKEVVKKVEAVDKPSDNRPAVVDVELKNKMSDNNQAAAVDGSPVIQDKQEPVVEPVFPEETKNLPEETKLLPEEAKVLPEETKVGNVGNKVVIKEIGKMEEVVTKKNDEVDIEAIKKEETELKEQENDKIKEAQDANKFLLDTIQKQNEVHKVIVEQQQKLIEVIQEQQKNVKNSDVDKVNEEKVKAVKKIETMAKQAIESISGQDRKVEGTEKNQSQAAEDKEPKVNPAPLSYQLGLDQEKIKDGDPPVAPVAPGANQVNLVPLPIALAKLHNASGVDGAIEEAKVGLKDVKKNADEVKGKKVADGANNNENASEVKAQEKIDNKKTVIEQKKQDSNEDALAMRRDILSNSGKLERPKRDADDENSLLKDSVVGDIDPAFKVCEQLVKTTSTEKPLIKMLCKLSDFELVDVGLKGLEVQPAAVDLKPQKRDLKNAPEE